MNRLISVHLLAILFLLPWTSLIAGQSGTDPEGSRHIEFPDIPGYQTLACDFHMHTVFSDGSVWPSIRVEEALQDGLDAISITDHLEYQPHRNDLPHPDRNRSYQLALESARGSGLMVIPGAEITRSMPPGHFNAIFIEDANALNRSDVMEVFREAKRQGAFVFWNHPHWTSQQPDGVATLTEMHLKLLEEGLFSGIEVVNETTYSDEALEIARQNHLTLMGNSDIHGLIDQQYQSDQGKHRPVTLVFAKERTPESLKQALIEHRTVVWFDNTLVGDPAFLVPLVEQSLEVKRAPARRVERITLVNHADADFILENVSGFRLHNHAATVVVKAHTSTTLLVKTLEERDTFDLRFNVLNAFTSPGTHPVITLQINDVNQPHPHPSTTPSFP